MTARKLSLVWACAVSVLDMWGCQCGVNPVAPVHDAGASDGGTSGAPDGSIAGDGGACIRQNGACLGANECCAGLACGPVSGAAGTYCRPDPTGGCGLNQTLCSGRCVVTRTDPANCGGCGIACDVGQVCTGSSCQPASSCPQGLSACSGSCVDLKASPAHCGACSAPCAPGRGCVAGSCVPGVPLDGGAPSCPGGGPAVLVGDAGTCAASVGQVSYRWAFCSCSDAEFDARLYTDSFNSQLGPYRDGGPGGSLGANGRFRTGATFTVNGTMWIAGDGGMNFGSSGNHVALDLHSNGPLENGGGLFSIGKSAHVNGDVNGSNAIVGSLTVPISAAVSTTTTVAGSLIRAPVAVPPACDCAPGQLVDVAGIVQHAAAANDNAIIGLDPDALNRRGNHLDLPCGRYYLTAIASGSAVTIAVHGRTAIFVAGDIDLGSPFQVTIDPQAELDLFIGGTLAVDAPVTLGSTEFPAQSRVYIAGSRTVSMGASAVIAGNFYLPWAVLGGGSSKDIYGSVFCGGFSSGAPLTIHYDRAVLGIGEQCSAAPDAGALDAGRRCNSCRDCDNQACTSAGACGACLSSSDCCAPLVCLAGTCAPQIN